MVIEKLTKEEVERKRNWDLERFLETLKAAVILAGWEGGNQWNDMNIEIAYKELHKNGIKLKIQLDERFLNRHYPV